MADTIVKEIKFEDLNNVYENNYSGTETFTWNDLSVKVKKNLSLTEVFQFVKTVTTSCFSQSTNEYIPEVKEFMIRYAALSTYSNIEVSDDIEEMHKLLFCTDIYDEIVKHIDGVQYSFIVKAINSHIEFQVSSSVSAAVKQVNEVVAGLNNLEDEMAKMFEGINPGDIKSVVDTIANGGLNTDSIVDSVLKSKKTSTVM